MAMSCLMKRSNGFFYGIFWVHGKQVWRSTGCQDREEALVVYEDLRNEHESIDRITILKFRKLLLELLDGKLAPATVALYSNALQKFAEIVGDIRLSRATALHVEKFISGRLKKVSVTKVNMDFRTLRAAFNRAVKYKMIAKNPFDDCENVRIPERDPQFLSKEEFLKLLKVVDDPRIRSIILLAVCTAMRLSEILNLHWEDIRFNEGLLLLRNRNGFMLKTRKGRVIPLNQGALAVLTQQAKVSDLVFPNRFGTPYTRGSVSRRFKKYARQAGLPEGIHFHSLRHTGATWLVERGVPITHVQALLGHSALSTTMVYAHTTPSHLRESVATLDGFLEEKGNP